MQALLTLVFLGLTVLTSWLVDRKCYAKRCYRAARASNANAHSVVSATVSANTTDATANATANVNVNLPQPNAGLMSSPARAKNLPAISEEETGPGGSSVSPQPQDQLQTQPDVIYEPGPPERLQMLPQANAEAQHSRSRTTSTSRYRHVRESVTAALGIRIVNDDTEEVPLGHMQFKIELCEYSIRYYISAFFILRVLSHILLNTSSV